MCKELYEALLQQLPPGTLSSMVKGIPGRNISRSKVVVIAHATLANFILDENPLVRDMRYIIVDESHVDDVGTEIVKTYCEENASKGLHSWFLSATHPNQLSTGSNYFFFVYGEKTIV